MCVLLHHVLHGTRSSRIFARSILSWVHHIISFYLTSSNNNAFASKQWIRTNNNTFLLQFTMRFICIYFPQSMLVSFNIICLYKYTKHAGNFFFLLCKNKQNFVDFIKKIIAKISINLCSFLNNEIKKNVRSIYCINSFAV